LDRRSGDTRGGDGRDADKKAVGQFVERRNLKEGPDESVKDRASITGDEVALKSEGESVERSRTATVAKLTGVRILLVEDDDDSRNLLALILERQGAEVFAASSSAEALDSFAQKSPDIVISDIGMPDVDGHELLRKIRALPET